VKKLIAAAAVLVATVAFMNRDVELTSLEHLQALERSDMTTTRAALTWINENALDHLPVSATLRAENAVAGFALSMNASEDVQVATR
jgi:hypothetical protein